MISDPDLLEAALPQGPEVVEWLYFYRNVEVEVVKRGDEEHVFLFNPDQKRFIHVGYVRFKE